MKRLCLIGILLLATALPLDAARPTLGAKRPVPTPCAVFTLERAVFSYVNCAVQGAQDLNVRRPYGWLAFVVVLLAAALLARGDDTLPRKAAFNAAIFLAALSPFAVYGYLLTAQVL